VVRLKQLLAGARLKKNFRLIVLALVLAAVLWAEGIAQFAYSSDKVVNAQQTGQTISLDQYWQLLQQTQDLAKKSHNQAEDVVGENFLQMANEWEKITTIQLPDGSLAPVNNFILLQRLRAEPPDPQALLAIVESILQESRDWPGYPFTGADLAKLDSILQRSEFAWQEEPERSPSIFAQWGRYLLDQLGRWLARLLENPGVLTGVEAGRWLVAGLGLAVLIWLLWVATRGLRRSLAAESELPGDLGAGDHLLNANAALGKAYELSDSGDYRMAVRYLYLSALLQLEENGVLRYDRAKTNREYLRSVRAMPGLHTSLVEVIDVFDRVWYGYQSIDQADFERYAAQAARLREQK
jgi:hypothetical protein